MLVKVIQKPHKVYIYIGYADGYGYFKTLVSKLCMVSPFASNNTTEVTVMISAELLGEKEN